VLKGAPSTEDFTLKPFDVVYVPKTELATADEFMTHIYNFIPRNIYFGFNYDVHTEFQDNNNNVETSGNP
jgi:hypothetical protein